MVARHSPDQFFSQGRIFRRFPPHTRTIYRQRLKISCMFRLPMLLAGFFVCCLARFFSASLSLGAPHSPHLFAVVFFDALGKAGACYRPASRSAARAATRSWQADSNIVRSMSCADRLAVAGDEQSALWQAHVERSKAQLKKLRWPRWQARFFRPRSLCLRYGSAHSFDGRRTRPAGACGATVS